MKSNDIKAEIAGFTKTLKPYAMNLTRDIESSEDLIQDTLVRAITNAEKFAEGTNLKAWLVTIMRNIFINNYRKASKYQVVHDTSENEFLLNSMAHTVKNEASRNFMKEDLNNAIESISTELSTPFMMYYNGFKYNEIAEKLHLPLGTVKSRIFFARKELKHSLEKVGITNSSLD